MNHEFILSHRDKQHDLDSSVAQPVIQKTLGSYVVDGVLRGGKSLISNEEQILKKFTRF